MKNYKDYIYCKPSIDDINSGYSMKFTEKKPCYHPSKCDIKTIVSHIKETGMRGVTSIGCGHGYLEWLLTEHFEPLAITGIDVGGHLNLIPQAFWKIKYGFIKRNEIAYIDDNNALCFCYPIRIDIKKYVEKYKGKCIIFVEDGTCDINFTEINNLLSEWKCIKYDAYGKGLTKNPQIHFYKKY